MEAKTSPVFREKMVAARSRDTIRSGRRTGKPGRQVVDRRVGRPDSRRAAYAAATADQRAGDGQGQPRCRGRQAQARELVSTFVGQGVGLVDDIPSCRQVVAGFMTEFARALDDMGLLEAGD
jgi:NAD(P)H-dependent flavin oxidoreductase YrpB (nitropropane dioxygenase family)